VAHTPLLRFFGGFVEQRIVQQAACNILTRKDAVELLYAFDFDVGLLYSFDLFYRLL